MAGHNIWQVEVCFRKRNPLPHVPLMFSQGLDDAFFVRKGGMAACAQDVLFLRGYSVLRMYFS